jgi:pilus assembly protein Flp/PilA
MSIVTKFLKGDSGTTAAEYALILALVGASIIASSNSVGTSIKTADGKVSNALAAAVARAS